MGRQFDETGNFRQFQIDIFIRKRPSLVIQNQVHFAKSKRVIQILVISVDDI